MQCLAAEGSGAGAGKFSATKRSRTGIVIRYMLFVMLVIVGWEWQDYTVKNIFSHAIDLRSEIGRRHRQIGSGS